MKLASHHSFLTVELPDDSKYLNVRITPTLKTVFRGWKPSTRISPIFGIEELGSASVTSLHFKGKNYLLFLGPIQPERILECDMSASKVWLTLGLYNVLVLTSELATKNKILRWARNQKIPAEAWTLRDDQIKHVDAVRIKVDGHPSWHSELSKLFDSDLTAELGQTIKDYCPLMATTLARSESLPKELVEDLLNTHRYIIDTLEDYQQLGPNASPYPTLGELITIHASLTRFSSQTLAGTGTILDRECHLRSHSLLGIGVPNIALARLRKFLELTLGAARLPERLFALSSITAKCTEFMPISG